MPKIAFSTLACPTWDFEQIVTAGIRDGYDGVEIRQVGGETDLLTVPAFERSRRAASREFLNRARTSAGSRSFSICGLASSVRFDYPQESQRDAQFSVGKAYVELAAEFEAGFVRVFGDVLPASSKSASSKPAASKPGERESALDQIADGLNRLGDFAARYEIDILLETHGDFADSTAVKDLFGRITSPRVGVLWDTHHPWRFCDESPESTFAILKPWVRHTHWKDSVTLLHETTASESVSDAEQGAFALMSGHRHADYVLFGGGEFPIARFVRLLKDSGYNGWLSLEWEKMWHPELAGPDVALPLFARKMREFWSMA